METAAASATNSEHRQIIESHYAKTPGLPKIEEVIPMPGGVYLVHFNNESGSSVGFFVTIKNGIVEEVDKSKVIKKKS